MPTGRSSVLLMSLAALLVATPAPAKRSPKIGSPETVIPPCYVPESLSTEGWTPKRLFSWPAIFLLPPSFHRARKPEFPQGGIRWSDGRRAFDQVSGDWEPRSFGSPEASPGYSECVDTLAGEEYRLISGYWPWYPAYAVVAVPTHRTDIANKFREALIGLSPDSSDQKLFLAIIRSLRSESGSAGPGPEANVARMATGVVTGRVTDLDGKPLRTASVILKGAFLGAVTDSAGRFTIEGVPPGVYGVRVLRIGFETVNRKKVRVVEDESTVIDFRLYPGSIHLTP